MRYAKPATTFEEQADLLPKRGMIGDRATLIARLSFVNYYRLSAYWWPFRKSGPTALERLDEFIEGAEFTTVWDHYAFDQRIRKSLPTSGRRSDGRPEPAMPVRSASWHVCACAGAEPEVLASRVCPRAVADHIGDEA